MKLAKTTLLSAAGVIVALGLTAAQAQDYGGEEAGGSPATGRDMGAGEPAGGGPEDAAPAGKAATEQKPGADMKGRKAGAGMKDEKAGAGMKDEKAGAEMKDEKARAGMKDEKAGAEVKDEKAGAEVKDEKAGPEVKDEKAGATIKDEKAGAESKDAMDRAAKDKGEPATEDKAGATADTKGGAEDADGKTAKVDPEQISKAKTYFRQNRPRVKAIDRSEISVSIGFALPGTIVLYDLPPDVIVVRGRCGIKYFLWGDDVVLVDSCTRRVVDIVALG